MALVKDYFDKTRQWQKEYGSNTVVLMQVGAFFEVYGLLEEDGRLTGSRIEDVCQVCDLNVANKVGGAIDDKRTKMAGFRDLQLDKYLRRLNDAGFTVIVYTQDTATKNTTRSLDGIYSPGTYFSDETVAISNNTMCVWIEQFPETTRVKRLAGCLAIGISVVDIYTGKTFFVSYETENKHSPAAYDELERCVSVYSPTEILLVTLFDERRNSEVVQFSGMRKETVRFINLNDSSLELTKKAKNAEKQCFQLDTLRSFYPDVPNVETLFFEYQGEAYAFQAFTFLLNYIYSHNPNLASKIQLPESILFPSRLVLANHSLKQLNILNTSEQPNSRVNSVSSLLNTCVSAGGKRAFMNVLLNPSCDATKIRKHYDATDVALSNGVWENMRVVLRDVKDIEKLSRKLVMKRCTPKDINHIYETCRSVQKLESLLRDSSCFKQLSSYLMEMGVTDLGDNIEQICLFIEKHIQLQEAKDIDTQAFASYAVECVNKGSCYIKPGFYESLDAACIGGIRLQESIEAIRCFLHALISKTESKGKGELVKLHETPTVASTLVTTKRRGAILKCELDKTKKKKIQLITSSNIPFEFDIESIIIEPASSKNDCVITSNQIRTYMESIKNNKQSFLDELMSAHRQVCDELLSYSTIMNQAADFIRQADLLQARCYIASNYRYCKPEIIESESSFLEASGLRHPLIEHIQTNEIYVTNDLILGKDVNGVLLFGTNAVGKTSLIKSIGISVIMAQAGLYVPCSSFKYSPYKSLFTRILGNDNIHRGLSTFAVEMIELRTILKMADKNSLILGDELCSGTESDSALSIFAAGIEQLDSVGCSFIFATHFHEIVEFDEVKRLEKVKPCHMSVAYDRTIDSLVYDRKLKDGPGDRMYGLEVCKALDLPSAFLERAHQLRNKYNKSGRSILDLKGSHFNRKKIVGKCEKCGKVGQEVHHLQHQKYADESGNIGHIHKNNLANLLTVCQECHDKFHETDKQYAKRKTITGKQVVVPLE